MKLLTVLACAASVMVGQQLSVNISPNPAPLGSNIAITATAAYAGLWTPGGCLVTAIRSGSPTGPVVRAFPCTLLSVFIPTCVSGATPRLTNWNQAVIGGAAAPGQYWAEIVHAPFQFGPNTVEHFCITIADPVTPQPVLTALNAPLWGNAFDMQLTDTVDPQSNYILVLSGSTNTGIPLGPGLHSCLDLDDLFNLSFPTPLPGVFFNFQGATDPAGQSPFITIAFPPAPPGLPCVPFHAQVLVVTQANTPKLSNGLSLTIK